VGALFILARNPVTGEAGPWAYWCGSVLSSGDPLFSPTVIQVAAGVLAAARWMFENPNAGILFPEDLPHATMLAYAAPFLGEVFSAPVDFTPVGTGFENFFISSGSGIPARLLR
jgi:homospermidine synthase